jgi:hypothetical protein
MLTRILFGLASVVAMVGMLWGTATPARACSCALPLSDDAAREVLESADLVVAGTVAETERDRVVLDVERLYTGEGGESVTVVQPAGFDGRYATSDFVEEIGADCSYTITGGPGERYVLVLQESEEAGSYEAQGCTSMSLRLTTTDDYFARSLEAIERAAEPKELPFVPEEEDGGGGFPWAAAGAIGVGAVIGLAGAGAFLWRRPSKHPS